MQLHTLLKINPLKALVNPVQTGTLKDGLHWYQSGSPRRKLVILKEEAMVGCFFSLTFVAETHRQRLLHLCCWLSVRSNTFVCETGEN